MGEAELLGDNLNSWRITSIKRTELRIALNFTKPVYVSQGDEKDLLFIFARFGTFNDNDGVPYPDFVFLQEELPL